MVISLGGEHSVTHPLVKAHLELWPDLCLLQVDAHADLRDTYLGSRYNHACPMRRIMDLGVHVTAVGIRSVDESEAPFLNGPLRKTFLDCQLAGSYIDIIPEIVDSLASENVYISFDLDGFDPAVVPAVGTPVPGGLGWREALALLRAVSENRTVVGADVVELRPTEGLHCSDSAAARLVYKIIAYKLQRHFH
jgi:agmatinase